MTATTEFHTPVLVKEAIDGLKIQPGKWYVDCNLGGGGHAREILAAGGKVLALDLDPDAIKATRQSLTGYDDRLVLYQTNFANLDDAVKKFVGHPVAGVLFDLGVSSYQLDTPERGFSFNSNSPLDMRMDQTIGASAEDLVNGLYEKELAQMFEELGEEAWAKPIARKIVQARKDGPITTTHQLSEIVRSVKRQSSVGQTNPATQVFQALRIAVNNELENIKVALPKALLVLEKGGRLAVISFHSLEDRIVKDFMKDESDYKNLTILTKKPISPGQSEISVNPRSRSAKLRVAEKV